MKNNYALFAIAMLLVFGTMMPLASAQIPPTSQWQSTNPIQVPEYGESCVFAGGIIYCMGGSTGSEETVQYASIAYGALFASWQTTNPLKVGTYAGSCVTANGYIYCMGTGAGSSTTVQYAQIQSGGTSAWQTTNPLKVGESYESCVTAGGYIYCMGGAGPSGNGPYDEVQYAQIQSGGGTGAWSSEPASDLLNVGAYALSCVAASTLTGNYIYCMGGTTNGGSNNDATVQYAAIPADGGPTGQWYSEPASDQLNFATSYSSCVTVNGYIYCMGGSTPTKPFYTLGVQYAQIQSGGGTGAWNSQSNLLAAENVQGSCITAYSDIYCMSGSVPATTEVQYASLTPSPPTPKSVTTCPQTYTASNTITTNFGSGAGDGSISQGTTSAQSTTPVISAVLQDNANNAQWLITCPLNPNAANTIEYFTSEPGSRIMGNWCLASGAPLVSTVTFEVDVSCTNTIVASATPLFTFQNVGRGDAYSLAYSGTTSYQSTGINDISNGYDSESYIFDQVPASTQYGLWTWSGEYADLSKVNPNELNIPTNTLSLALGPYTNSCQYDCKSGTCSYFFYTCTYPYTYTVSAEVTEIYNTNIPVPTQPQISSSSYMIVNGNYYSPFIFDDEFTGPTCANWLLWGNQKSIGDTVTCPDGSAYTIVDISTVVYEGTAHPGTAIYTKAGDTNSWYYAVYFVPWWGPGIAGSPSWQGGYVNYKGAPQQYVNVGALPYLLYNISMPASYSLTNSHEQLLNLSFDLYGSRNFLDPSDYMGQLPLYTGSGFFAGEGGKLNLFPGALDTASTQYADADALQSSNGIFLSSLTQASSGAPGYLGPFGGDYAEYDVPNPVYIASSPDDHVYVLASSTPHAWTTDTYLYTMRFIPNGYYNLSNDQPGSVTTQSLDWDTWNSAWTHYWTNAGDQQSASLYITSVTDLSSCNTWLHTCTGTGGWEYPVNPFAIASDYASDIFILGHNPGNPGFILAEIPSNSQSPVIETQITQPSGFTPGQEFAVSPSGQYVYVASVENTTAGPFSVGGSGQVNVYQTPTGGGGASAGSSSLNFSYAGNLTLSYSNSSYNLDIAQYLKNGGPFDDSAVASAYAAAVSTNDTALNHYPVAIADVEGTLYVLDNWTFTVDGAMSSILMLRAFRNGSQEIPIDGSSHSAMVPIYGAQASISQGRGATPSNGWAPYGWPISASIDKPGKLLQLGGEVEPISTYCAAGCTYTPSNISTLPAYLPAAYPLTAYPPIGPEINGTGYVSDFGFSVDFNDTAYLVARVCYISFGTSLGGAIFCSGSGGYPIYTELLAFKLALSNYTQASLGAYTPYACYIDNGGFSDNSPCIYSDSPLLTNMRPPVEGVPSSLAYVESEGSPKRYLSLQNLLSSALPFGAGSGYNSSAASENSTGKIPAAEGGATPLSNYNSISVPSGAASQPVLPATYINSVITGSLLVPYCSSYDFTQTWSPGTPFASASSSPPSGCTETCGAAPQGVTWPTSSGPTTYYICGTANAPLQNNHLNNTVEGGGTYLQSVPNMNYYTANLSDAGAISLPYVDYDIFTSRIFGEAYANITINPTDYGFYKQAGTCTNYFTFFSIKICTAWQASSSPWVVNAVQTYGYQLVNLMQQDSSGNSYPAYAIQSAVPVTPTGTITFSTSSDSTTSFTPSSCTLSSGSCTISYSDTAVTAPLITAAYSGNWSPTPTVSISCATYIPNTPITCTATATEGLVGADCGSSCPAGYYYSSSPSSYFAGGSALSYSSNTQINSVPLFSVYEQTAQLDSMILDLSSNPNVLGYNRLIYTFVDAFNNIIDAPLDADFSYPTQITLTPDVTINALNANESTVNVIGTATYTTPTGSGPLANNDIYLYYDANLNYYDTVNTLDSSLSSYNPLGYYQDSLLCAFSPGTQACQLANPLYTTMQEQPVGLQEADTPLFHTDYNATGQCDPEPKSLLAAANIVDNCNIYGSYGLPAARQDPYDPTVYQSCLPEFINGSGIFTSQLGLVQIVTTDSNGNFNYQFNVCGNGDQQVIARYYGYPPPEPVSMTQTPLPTSAGANEFVTAPVSFSSPEFNYTYAPVQANAGITIGAFALGFGGLNALAVLALVIAMVIIARRMRS